MLLSFWTVTFRDSIYRVAESVYDTGNSPGRFNAYPLSNELENATTIADFHLGGIR
jgi:hypothetical protein